MELAWRHHKRTSSLGLYSLHTHEPLSLARARVGGAATLVPLDPLDVKMYEMSTATLSRMQ